MTDSADAGVAARKSLIAYQALVQLLGRRVSVGTGSDREAAEERWGK
jgi:hypothetical protein